VDNAFVQKLSNEQRLYLEKLVKKTRDVNERNRSCVILGRDDGHSPREIAAILRISESSVYDYQREYDAKQKTINDPHCGKASKLTADQEAELKRHLSQMTYLKVGKICLYVLEAYQVKYTVAGMTNWLKRNGFVYKHPIKVPGKLDPVKQAAFLEKYDELKAGLQEGEKIFFGDAVHPEYQSQSVAGWIPKNEIKTLGTTAKQERLHFIGAVELTEMQILMKEYSTVDAASMIDFLKMVADNTDAKKIHLILDNGRSNKNKEVQKYLDSQTKIQIHYLPPYSPNLNAIERLWKVMRERITYNKIYSKFNEFTEKIRDFFSTGVVDLKDMLKRRINDNFQKIELNPLQTSIC
jgi:transposase